MNYLRRAKNYIFGESQSSQQSRSGDPGSPDAGCYDDTDDGEPVARQGFKKVVKREVVRPREPVLVDSGVHNQRVQGMEWYASRLKRDKDGDVAHEFLELDSPDDGAAAPEKEKQAVMAVKVQEMRIENGAVICCE